LRSAQNINMRDKPDRLEPAASIIAQMGGVEAVALITKRHVSRVYRWMYPKENGGSGGIIPQAEAAKLLAHARDNRIKLNAADFFGKRAA
jgi:hypothetical protein